MPTKVRILASAFIIKMQIKEQIKEVSVVKCKDYSQKKIDEAVSKALKLIEFNPENYRNKKILIKPNILGSYEKNQIAITTHPSVVRAVCKIFKKVNAKIYIGESSFMNTDKAFKKSGIEKIAKEYSFNKKPIIFEQEKLIKIHDNKSKILKTFPIAEIVKKVDLIVNIPKMKTHSLARVTLGIKNLYGLIPGGLKQRFHKKAGGNKFSEILVDIYQNVKDKVKLNILDGVVGMEGHGPASGEQKKSGFILASKDTVALDIAASKIMDFNPKKIPAIKFSVKRGLYTGYGFELKGLKKLPVIHFKKPRELSLKSKLRRLFSREQPIVCDIEKCIKCGTCAKHCPAKAITLKPYPIIDKRKCIRCFCCMEVCPVNALSLGKPGDNMWQNSKNAEKN